MRGIVPERRDAAAARARAMRKATRASFDGAQDDMRDVRIVIVFISSNYDTSFVLRTTYKIHLKQLQHVRRLRDGRPAAPREFTRAGLSSPGDGRLVI